MTTPKAAQGHTAGSLEASRTKRGRWLLALCIGTVLVSAALLAFLLGWADLHQLSLYAYVVITVGWLIWLTVDRADGWDSTDKATDDADRALAAVQAVINHLAETEPATTGRHALAPAVAMTKEQLL